MKELMSILLFSGVVQNAMAAGPDVIVGDIPAVHYFGQSEDNKYHAFAFATTSCNMGDQAAKWFSPASGHSDPSELAKHPVIAQNLYRVKDDRLEQVGMSWLKHAFLVAAGSRCRPCTQRRRDWLDVNCSDPYTATRNGDQGNLGPRSEVNASSGVFPYPPRWLDPAGLDDTSGRLRVHRNDLPQTSTIADRVAYFVEAHYVTEDYAQAGNGSNNASYRKVQVTPDGNGYSVRFDGETVREHSVLYGWQAMEPRVRVFTHDVPRDGRFLIGLCSIPRNEHLEHILVVQNLNSDRAVSAVSVDFDRPGAVAANSLGFHDCDYHSGEPYSSADWSGRAEGTSAAWKTETFSQNANANAIRWSTAYTFWCTADAIPKSVRITLFKPGQSGEPNDFVLDVRNNPFEFFEPVVGGQLRPLTREVWSDRSSVELGRFRLKCPKALKRDIASAVASDPRFLVSFQSVAGAPQESAWDIVVRPREGQSMPTGPVESLITIQTQNGDDLPLTCRLNGTIAAPPLATKPR